MILTDLPLVVDIDLVLRAQGLKPDLVKTKSPKLIEITQKAIETGKTLIEPRVVYERFVVQRVTSNGLELKNGKSLSGELISTHFKKCRNIAAAICTIGGEIDAITSESFHQNPAFSMALEGFASAATEILGNSFCNYLDTMVKSEGLSTSLPVNPGMVGWPVEEGQPQLFSLLDFSSIGVKLEESGLMKPLKTLSMVIGIGHEVNHHSKSCDLCNLQKTCLYRPDRVESNPLSIETK